MNLHTSVDTLSGPRDSGRYLVRLKHTDTQLGNRATSTQVRPGVTSSSTELVIAAVKAERETAAIKRNLAVRLHGTQEHSFSSYLLKRALLRLLYSVFSTFFLLLVSGKTPSLTQLRANSAERERRFECTADEIARSASQSTVSPEPTTTQRPARILRATRSAFRLPSPCIRMKSGPSQTAAIVPVRNKK